MSRQFMINQIAAQWSQLGITFQAGQGTDLMIYSEFIDAEWRTGNRKIVYDACLFVDESTTTVFMWEKMVEAGGDLSGGFDAHSSIQNGTILFRKVKSIQNSLDGRIYEYEFDLGDISKIVQGVAGQFNWQFKTVLEKSMAMYTGGFQVMGSNPKRDVNTMTSNEGSQQNTFCANCGNRLETGSQFCGHCGLPISTTPKTNPIPLVSAGQPQDYPYRPQGQQTSPVQQYTGYPVSGSSTIGVKAAKSKMPLIIGLSTLGIVLIAAAAIMGLGKINDRLQAAEKTTTVKTTAFTASQTTATTIRESETTILESEAVKPTEDSSILSKGVNLDDMGNIMNGQYYFDDGSRQFYSSFDKSGAAHIYAKDIKTSTVDRIFDGFGWSLTLYDGWLYFSGNQGTAIDGSYNLFRIRPDGSDVEKINDAYCFGMSVYKNDLYYVTGTDWTAKTYSVCRSKLDGSNEETLVANFSGYCIIFENALYYAGVDGILYRADPDGTQAVPVISSDVVRFVIGNGKLIYTDRTGNIMMAEIDGKNATMIRQAGSLPVYSLNSSKDVVYYTLYDATQNKDQYACFYELHRIGFDGSDDQTIYTSASYGTYLNIVHDKVYVLDYASDASSGILAAVAIEMDIKGGGTIELPR